VKKQKHYGDTLKCVPVYMGIDQSYTGFAVTLIPVNPKDGSYETFVYKGQGTGIDRIIDIQDWLLEIIRKYQVVDCALESPVKMSHSALMSGELFGAVRLVIKNELNQYPLQVPPTMVKKYVTGKGTGIQKNQMLLQVYKTWNVEFDDDNAADSFGIAKIVSGEAKYAYQKDVINKLQDLKFRDQPL